MGSFWGVADFAGWRARASKKFDEDSAEIRRGGHRRDWANGTGPEQDYRSSLQRRGSLRVTSSRLHQIMYVSQKIACEKEKRM